MNASPGNVIPWCHWKKIACVQFFVQCVRISLSCVRWWALDSIAVITKMSMRFDDSTCTVYSTIYRKLHIEWMTVWRSFRNNYDALSECVWHCSLRISSAAAANSWKIASNKWNYRVALPCITSISSVFPACLLKSGSRWFQPFSFP